MILNARLNATSPVELMQITGLPWLLRIMSVRAAIVLGFRSKHRRKTILPPCLNTTTSLSESLDIDAVTTSVATHDHTATVMRTSG